MGKIKCCFEDGMRNGEEHVLLISGTFVLAGKQRIEELLALGASRWEATHAARRRCIRMALMPTLNQMNVVGIVAIPGIMTGQILQGSDPSQVRLISSCAEQCACTAPRYCSTSHVWLLVRRHLLKFIGLLSCHLVPIEPSQARLCPDRAVACVTALTIDVLCCTNDSCLEPVGLDMSICLAALWLLERTVLEILFCSSILLDWRLLISDHVSSCHTLHVMHL